MNCLNKSDVDIAYLLLSKAGTSMYYKDLIMEIIQKKYKSVQSLATTISEIYTLINMDSRFNHEGKNMWGLTEWLPADTKNTSATILKASSKESKKKQRREKLFEGIQEN